MQPISAQIEGIEFVVILIIVGVLLFFGPRFISPLFKSIGRAKGEYEKGKVEVQREIDAMKDAGKR